MRQEKRDVSSAEHRTGLQRNYSRIQEGTAAEPQQNHSRTLDGPGAEPQQKRVFVKFRNKMTPGEQPLWNTTTTELFNVLRRPKWGVLSVNLDEFC